MLIGIERLMAELRAVGLDVEGPFESGGLKWAIVPEYTIPGGRFAGTSVRVGLAAPADFPQTPPGGLYINAKLVPALEMSSLNVHDRPETAKLPGEWQYWSRPLPPNSWLPEKSAKRLLTHWNAVMINVEPSKN